MDILEKTKLQMLTHPELLFYAIMASQLNVEMDSGIPTACTDGKRIRFNPNFVAQQTPSQLLGLYVHEVKHVVYTHGPRRGERDPHIWNLACDYAINGEILDMMGLELPDSPLYNPDFNGMSAEQIYDLLMQDPPDQRPELMDIDEVAPEDAPVIQQEMETLIVQAAMIANTMSPGSIPNAVQIFLDSRVKPKVPWYKVLRRYLQPLRASRYTMTRPNRRFLPMYCPKLDNETKKLEITVAWDMSGSVELKDTVRYISETWGIAKSMKADLTVIQFDTRIQHVDHLRKIEDFKRLEYHGRGGTDLRCIMEYVNEHNPEALVIFTDGYFRIPPKPACPVVWIIIGNSNFNCPYGKVIHVEK